MRISRTSLLVAVIALFCGASAFADTVYVPWLASAPPRITKTFIATDYSVSVAYDKATQRFTAHGIYGSSGLVYESITENGVSSSEGYGTFDLNIKVDTTVGRGVDENSYFRMTDYTGNSVYFNSVQLSKFGYWQNTASPTKYEFYMQFFQKGPSVLVNSPDLYDQIHDGREFAVVLRGGQLSSTAGANLFGSNFNSTSNFKADVYGTPVPQAVYAGGGLLFGMGVWFLRARRLVPLAVP